MSDERDQFVEYLKNRRPRAVYLKPYRGNSGDGLIWKGMESLLAKLGIKQVLDGHTADMILWPGGNPTMYQCNLEGWQDCWRSFPNAEFVVAPATFQGEDLDWRTLLRTTTARIGGLFARDPESYRNLKALGLSGETVVGLGHDPAFHLRGSEWIAGHSKAATTEYILASFRGDHESALRRPKRRMIFGMLLISSIWHRYWVARIDRFHQRRLDNIKANSSAQAKIMDVDASLMSFEFFIETVRRASEVHSDRLHCVILAALLGKKVFAYETAYAKIENVYAHSMKEWSEVQFMKRPL